MCGIAGLIGESKDPIASFEILTQLFKHTQSRGEDAAGFWGVEAGEHGAIAYHKEPGKSTEFIQKKIWKKMNKFNADLMMLHCRAATLGSGSPAINKNNHPFVSSDKTVSLIHNGKVPDIEYRALEKRYETVSSCDSEILLRIIENGNDREVDKLKNKFYNIPDEFLIRLAAISDIWSYMSYGAMAVAIGERLENNGRRLWLFRNKHRTLWLSDLRQTLGQVFFFSTPKIWREAVESCYLAKRYTVNNKIIEFPDDEIWMMELSKDQRTVGNGNMKKFNVETTNSSTPWKLNGESFTIDKKECPVRLITKLDDDDNVITKHKPKVYEQSRSYVATQFSNSNRNIDYEDDEIFELTEENVVFRDVQDTAIATNQILSKCSIIRKIVDDIEVDAENKLREGSMTDAGYSDLIESLEQIETDLSNTLQFIEQG